MILFHLAYVHRYTTQIKQSNLYGENLKVYPKKLLDERFVLEFPGVKH
jgi:hypothetical protein